MQADVYFRRIVCMFAAGNPHTIHNIIQSKHLYRIYVNILVTLIAYVTIRFEKSAVYRPVSYSETQADRNTL